MFPLQAANLDLDALSGICGSISIACWVVVFSPQIVQNFRQGSADGLSLLFLAIWLAGDVFNILGAVLQGVLPTMIMLAVYYTLADIVLLGQCFYYRGFTLRDDPSARITRPERDDPEENAASATERTALLSPHHHAQDQSSRAPGERGHSFRDSIHPPSVDATHLSPATPLVEPSPDIVRPTRNVSTLQNIAFNVTAVALVCAAGVLGWYVSPKNKAPKSPDSENAALSFDTLGQVFGYLCAVLYLGSRLPQLLLNYKRKSTEGVSLLFFLFACIGNLAYVLSIFAYSPVCEGDSYEKTGHCQPGEAGALYWRYILVNLSWLIGSFGTLLQDMAIFTQFFLYKDNEYAS
ncbi:PQ-loop repeat-containing protein [Aspergillus glaucus CBS 516.65]|uniref:Uncharacterized protein n=1 Tax=Aspergillus glaucus CBS 516.65 TaxID=1160497 RepID=A0A1L9V6T8_ASPGL|nr:hypothetical protein ASPGLDRAFT_136530 [Aspergillus glaucus CBS 516.65]OJJ79644.1 hypothetical protein ASPGLDRAFT_136530 [Aspergillus glaucus CBS 516.65]